MAETPPPRSRFEVDDAALADARGVAATRRPQGRRVLAVIATVVILSAAGIVAWRWSRSSPAATATVSTSAAQNVVATVPGAPTVEAEAPAAPATESAIAPTGSDAPPTPSPSVAVPNEVAEARAAADDAFKRVGAIVQERRSDVFMKFLARMRNAREEGAAAATAGDHARARTEYGKVVEVGQEFDVFRERMAGVDELDRAFRAKVDEAHAMDLPKWQDAHFRTAMTEESSAVAAVKESKVEEAQEALRRALAALDAGIAALEAESEQLLSRARGALAVGDGAGARKAISDLVSRKPQHPDVAGLSARAMTIDIVFPLYEWAVQLEGEGLLENAEVKYVAALDQDPNFAEARAALERVRLARRDQLTIELRGRAEVAFANREFDVAYRHIVSARDLKPNDPATLALFPIIEQDHRAEQGRRQMAEGQRLESVCAWNEAITLYRAMLAEQPGLVAAEAGLVRASEGARKLVRYRAILARAAPGERSEDAAQINQTLQLLLTARELAQCENANLDLRIEVVRNRLMDATKPVKVVLVSDGLTNVEFWKVGKYEPFREKVLEIAPGTYTVVGWRPGYVDVRLEVKVNVGADEVRVVVVCAKPV